MESTRDKALKIVELVNEQTNIYDAIDVITELLEPESKSEIRSYKGNDYIVLSQGQMKNPENGTWQKCIHYQSIKEGQLYTREKKDFDKKFLPSET